MIADEYVINRIKSELKRTGKRRDGLASHLDRSPAWVTKLLAGRIAKLSDISVAKIEEYLGFRFFETREPQMSPLDQKVKELTRKPEFMEVAFALINLHEAQLRTYYEEADLDKLGEEILKITSKTKNKKEVAQRVIEMLIKLREMQ